MAEENTQKHHRQLLTGQNCVVHIYDADAGVVTEVLRTRDRLLEAPNWPWPDRLLLNGDGLLWTLDLGSGALQHFDIDGLPFVNNDHVPAPDGKTLYVSCYDWRIHGVSIETRDHWLVSRDEPSSPLRHFLHGVSPNGKELAFVGVESSPVSPWGAANIYTMDIGGGRLRQWTHGDRPADGCEYSPDGGWIYFNTEALSKEKGHAQIARLERDSGAIEQLTFDSRVNWFPHLAPTGDLACYLSYPEGTMGHPENCPVDLCLVRSGEWAAAETVARLFGGQGTINVNSWSPDGRRFAYVSYPMDQ
ncbi:TolB protein [Rhizobium sp. SG_E_25_P2]|uniref:biopolymer transporter Tol n=1 Tax=Rhizobium sp. SG_E_25_P2 TaxID=2879942 RepID=UPI00247452F7|nr:biopolymer transporter Tol [Rhizobium sp. SG_E_25_P2]MDH6268838.1 TolB protein [Rhizobium sp. SG_E_25_P2]